jgi:AraC-like DNA-binding protein
MKLFKNSVCLVLTAPEMFLRIESLLKNRYSFIWKTDVDVAISFTRNQLIECIIIQADDRFIISSVELLRLRTQFPMIPTIIIIKDQNLKFARLCGELGVEYVISISELRELGAVVKRAIYEKCPEISFSAFGIDMRRCSPRVQEALKIIKEEYIKLMSVREISDLMGISESTLTKYFGRCCPIGPKRLLTFLKLRYAMHLMKNPGLRINEIGRLVGYSDPRRFNECFHRILGISPVECRKRVMNENINDIIRKMIIKIIE